MLRGKLRPVRDKLLQHNEPMLYHRSSVSQNPARKKSPGASPWCIEAPSSTAAHMVGMYSLIFVPKNSSSFDNTDFWLGSELRSFTALVILQFFKGEQ